MATRRIIRTKRPSTAEDTSAKPVPASAPFNPFAAINFARSATTSSVGLGIPPPAEKKETVPAAAPAKPEGPRADGEEARKKLRRLNRAFLSWLERQTQVNPLAVWKAGVVDYIKYASALRETLDKATQSEEKSIGLASSKAVPAVQLPVKPFESAPPAASSMPSFTPKPEPQPQASVLNPPAPFAGFSGSSTLPHIPAFGAAASASLPKPAFSFPAFAPAAPSAQTGGLSFSIPPLPKGPLSSIGAAPFLPREEEEEGEGEEEPILEPEKVSRNPEDRDEILHEVPCKLFRYAKETSEWKDAGKGSFRVTRDPETRKTRMLIRNTLGKVALNSSFYKGMAFQQAGNAAIRFAAVAGDDGKLQSLMLKLKPADVAKTLEMLIAQIAALS